MKNDTKGYITSFFYALIVSLSFLFVKIALETSSPLELLAYRFSLAFLAILILLASGLVKIKLSAKVLIDLLPLALFYPLIYFPFQAYGIMHTTSLEGGIINAVIPVFTLINARIFLKEETNIMQKLSIFMSVIGVIYISYMKGQGKVGGNLLGILFLLMASLAFSFYSIVAKIKGRKYKSIEMTIVSNFYAFIVFNIMALVNSLYKGSISTLLRPLANRNFIFAILYLGILSTLGTSFLSNYSLSKIDASKMSVFVNLATVLSIFASALILKEKVHYYHIIGSTLIILGVLGTNFLGKKKDVT